MASWIGFRGTEEQRFWSKVQVNYETGCWEWIAGLNGGYGWFILERQSNGVKAGQIGAHIWSYIYFNGPTKDGTEVHHKCENKKCVNPDHLESLIYATHVAISGGCCTKNATKLYCNYGHMMVGENIDWSKGKDGTRYRRCLTCRREFTRIKNRKYRSPEYRQSKQKK